MPPRKRARVSRTASSTPISQPKTPTADASNDSEEVFNDAWTDEEEIGLLKGLVRWKPTGIHKHFRLLQLHHFLLENGYIHPRNEHTRPQGIWRKLQSLYDLEALDQREDARQLSDQDVGSDEQEDSEDDDEESDVYSLAANKIHNEEFNLDGKGGDGEDVGPDFGRMMWARRVASAKERRDESPVSLPEINLADEPPMRFTPTVSVEPSDIATPSSALLRKGATSMRGKGRGGAASNAGTRRSTRQAESVQEESQDEEGEEEEEEESSSEDEDGESEENTPAPRSSRSGRGRSSRGRGRGRGRGK